MKSLLIVPGFLPPESTKKALSSAFDLLALTPLAMLQFHKLKLPYKTLDDFYPVQAYRSSLDAFDKSIDELFKQLDALCARLVGFSEPFSSNIYNFIRLLEDLFYIQLTANNIQNTYNNIYIMATHDTLSLNWHFHSYSDIRRMDFTAGLNNQLALFASILNATSSPFQHETLPLYAPPLRILIENRLFKYLQNLRRNAAAILNTHTYLSIDPLISRHNSAKSVFIIQPGFDLTYVINKLHPLKCLYPIKPLEQSIFSLESVDISFQPIHDTLIPFLRKHLPHFTTPLLTLFENYTTQVVARIPAIKSEIEATYDRYKPKAAFYSVGAYSPVETLFATIANSRDIPVFYFQHGGTTAFLPRRNYTKYMENKKSIKKILFLNGQAEYDSAFDSSTQIFVAGSIRSYNSIKKRYHLKHKAKTILYCCGNFNFYSYRMLGSNMSDTSLFIVTQNIVSVAMRHDIPLDIKLHPIEEKFCYVYYRELIAHMQSPANIIYGVPAEFLIAKYGLVIIDYLSSAIVPLVLGFDIPVVLYLDDTALISRDVSAALHDRCYVVNDELGLNDVLLRFRDNALPSKFTDNVLNDFVFPPNTGNPLDNIVAHILQHIA